MSDTTKLSSSLQYLSDFSTSKKDQKWDVHRQATQNIEAIFRDGEEVHQKQSHRMKQCSGVLSFAWTEPNEHGETKLKLRMARFCHVRSCPVCQWRRSMAWQYRMFSAFEPLSIQFPKHRWLFLTLTIKNTSVTELKETVKQMQSAFTRLRKRKEWDSVHGYIKSLEVTRGADGSAHPHFHILMIVPSGYFSGRNYVTQQMWRELWGSCLRVNYLPVVQVQTIKSKNPENPHDISAAVVEVLKYETKISDLENHPDFLLELSKQMVRVRSVEVGGILKEYLKSNEPVTDEELIGTATSEETVSELLNLLTFNWREAEKKYKKLT